MSISIAADWQRDGFHLSLRQALPGRGVTALFGPSGCGKTSVLRLLAGLEKRVEASVSVDGDIWQDASTFVPAHVRPVAYVFQEPGLFPHLNVEQNLHYGMKRIPATRRRVALPEVIELLGLEHLLRRKPAGLSGGEQQRVAIARALAVSPSLLLLDEPMAALDIRRKQEFLPYLEALLQQLDIPAIYVSHAPEEVARLADHVLLMEAGRVVAAGPVNDVFNRLDLSPAHERGARTAIQARVVGNDEGFGLCQLEFAGGTLLVSSSPLVPGTEVKVQIAATDVSLTLDRQQGTSILNVLAARVDAIVPEGDSEVLVRLLLEETPILARITRKSAVELGLQPGSQVYAQIKGIALAR